MALVLSRKRKRRIDEHALALDVVMREGKKKSLDIAQVKEVLSITLRLLGGQWRQNPKCVVERLKRQGPILLSILFILSNFFIAGCPAPQTFTPRSDGVLAAQADLAATANATAVKVEGAGTAAHSPDSTFLVGATGVWRDQCGPGKVLPSTPATVAAEAARAEAAKVAAAKAAEAERLAHIAQLKEKDDRIAAQVAEATRLKTDLEKAQAAAKTAAKSQALADMWSKLFGILTAASIVIVAMLWFGPTRALAPVAAIGFAGLAAAVVVRACAGDITIVLVLAGVAVAVYLGVMWFIQSRKGKSTAAQLNVVTDVIEQLPKTITIPPSTTGMEIALGSTVKAAVQKAAGDAGIQPALAATLAAKGYSTPAP